MKDVFVGVISTIAIAAVGLSAYALYRINKVNTKATVAEEMAFNLQDAVTELENKVSNAPECKCVTETE